MLGGSNPKGVVNVSLSEEEIGYRIDYSIFNTGDNTGQFQISIYDENEIDSRLMYIGRGENVKGAFTRLLPPSRGEYTIVLFNLTTGDKETKKVLFDSSKAKININSVPSGAIVKLYKYYTGEFVREIGTTPLSNFIEINKQYEIIVSKPGYSNEVIGPINLQKGEEFSTTVYLNIDTGSKYLGLVPSLDTLGTTVRITTNPSGATIYTGTTERGITPPTGSLDLDLAPDYYQFRAVKEGYNREIYETTLEYGDDISLNMNLTPINQQVFPYVVVGLLVICGYYLFKGK